MSQDRQPEGTEDFLPPPKPDDRMPKGVRFCCDAFFTAPSKIHLVGPDKAPPQKVKCRNAATFEHLGTAALLCGHCAALLIAGRGSDISLGPSYGREFQIHLAHAVKTSQAMQETDSIN